MSPLHFMMQMSRTFASATLKAQSAWWDASLAATDKVTRAPEKPEDAATRAIANAEAGVSQGWYRAPPATWSEISDRAAGVNPANAMMNATGWPMLLGPPFGGASAFQNPFLEMLMTPPTGTVEARTSGGAAADATCEPAASGSPAMADSQPFWPAASGFGAVPHSTQPPILETTTVDDKDD